MTSTISRTTTRSDINLSVQVYLEDVEQFLLALNDLSKKGQYDVNTDSFEVNQNSSLPCVASNKQGSYTPITFESRNAAVNPFLEKLSKQTNYGYSLADCVADAHFGGKETSVSKFTLKHDGNDLVLQIAVRKASPQSAAALVSALTDTFARFRKLAAPLRQTVIDGTSARAVK